MSRIVLIAAIIILSGCGQSATSLEDHKELAESLQLAEIVEFYEGLPHQHFEPQLLLDELDTNKTITFDEFPFYAVPLELTEEDSAALANLFCESNSFVPIDLTAAKACGGFHPDYCLAWKVGSKTYYALLCFGCHEVKAAGNGLELHVDIRKSAYDAFVSTLRAYQKNRPSRQP